MNPPLYGCYVGAWMLAALGLWSLACGLVEFDWPLAAIGIVALTASIGFVAGLAIWRDTYNDGYSEDGHLVYDSGRAVPRVLLMSDAVATCIVRVVRPSFRRDHDGR